MAVRATLQRTPNAGGRETRRLLIATAERLFAEHGIDAVSLRQVAAVAGLRMSSAVSYHFGGRDGLIQAIIDDRMVSLDQRCGEMLAELERAGRTDDLRAVTEAAIRPCFEALGHTGYFFRFLTQLDRHPQLVDELQTSGAFLPASRRLMKLQDAAAGRQLPPKLVAHRRRAATHLLWAEAAELERSAQGADEALVADLVECVVAVYAAPSSARPAPRPVPSRGDPPT